MVQVDHGPWMVCAPDIACYTVGLIRLWFGSANVQASISDAQEGWMDPAQRVQGRSG